MNEKTALLAILISAAVTAVIRVIPFLIFTSSKKTPPMIEKLGKMLPPAVMGMLVIFCLKDVSFSSAGAFLPELIASIIVILAHIWKRNTLLSIFIGTAVYMLLVQLVFV